MQALDYTQGHEQKLLDHTKKLSRQIDELQSQLHAMKQASKGKSRKKKNADPHLDYKKLTLWGKKYALTVSPWALPMYFMVSPPKNSPHPDSIERLASFEAYKAGGAFEIQEYLSGEAEMCKQAAEYPPFCDAVCELPYIAFIIFVRIYVS